MNFATIENVISIVNMNIGDIKLNKSNIYDDLVQFGIDSLSFIKIIMILENYYKVEVPDVYLILSRMNTIKKIKDIIESLQYRIMGCKVELYKNH